jgi:hypothetical protein
MIKNIYLSMGSALELMGIVVKLVMNYKRNQISQLIMLGLQLKDYYFTLNQEVVELQ